MRRQLKYLAAAASLLTLMTACTADKLEAYYGQPNPNPETPDNAISFGTYMGRTGTTRAGSTAAMTTDKLKESGFGVFGYYTGNDLYQNSGTSSAKESTTGEAIAANFMYNQQVKWQTGTGYEGYVNGEGTGESAGAWTYTPIKYWPNDIAGANAAVDDQDNDKGNNYATGSATYGGNVSFFAYAPFVSGSDLSGATVGITHINNDQTIAGSAASGPTPATGNQMLGNPTITYKLAATTGSNVDLLWGTKGKTSSNVLGASQEKEYVWASDAVGKGPVNINLTKQKTNGVVDFTFKHALSKVGGSTHPGDTEGTKSGLMVKLDIDDMKGAETGGTKDATTLVTINSIEIKATAKTVDSSNKKPGDDDYNATYFKNEGAVLDLATGVWTLPSGSTTTTSSDATQITHTIISSSSAQATLNEKIKEETPTWASESNQWQVSSAEKKGVETTEKNVYDAETSPLLFIPGTYPELEITVDYIVRTYDANLTTPTGENSPCSKIQQKITKKVTFEKAVELNKQYSLLMHLGLTSVKFTATVSNWSFEGDTDNDGVIDEGETIKVDDVYLPINVQDATTAQTISAGSNTIVNTAAVTTEYTITLKGLTASNTLTLNAETGSNIDLSSTKVCQTDGTTEITASGGKYTVASDESSVVIKVKLNTNSDTSNAKANKLTITEKNGETVKSTTTITITQNKATS